MKRKKKGTKPKVAAASAAAERAWRRSVVVPLIREAREVVRARKRPGGLADEAAHTHRLKERVRTAREAAEEEERPALARSVSHLAAAILKEAPSRQTRMFNPSAPTAKRGARVWDRWHKWTAEVVKCWPQHDEDGPFEVCTLRRVGNPPPGEWSGAGIKVGETYVAETRNIAIVPARVLKNPKVEDRASKAVRLVAAALKAGVVLHLSGARGTATVGPYHTAVPVRADDYAGPAAYALLMYSRTHGNRDETFSTAAAAADHAVARFGVTNVITALKRAAKKHGAVYQNLDTPMRWATRNPAAEPVVQGLLIVNRRQR
jgi:hypothetical protein